MSRHIIRDEDVYPKATQQTLYKKTEKEQLKESYIYSDHPSTIENGTATFFYIIIMLAGTIFIDRLLIWAMASIIYFRFINRYQTREKEWKQNAKNK